MLKRIIFSLITLAVVVYAGLMLALIFGQRTVVFLPSRSGDATPAAYGVPFEALRIPSGDGILDAWWIGNPEDAHRPTLLYCHGNGGNLSRLSHVAKIFYDYGWNALLFDYRGYGKSTQPADAQITEDRVVEDAENSYLWLQQRVARKRLFFWGHSLGSSICAHLSLKHPPAGLVIEGAFPSAYKMARHRYPWAAITPFMLFDKFATEDYLKESQFPILQIHADPDLIVPFSMGEQLFMQLPEPKIFMPIPDIGHTGFPDVAPDYQEKITSIVRSWIQPEEVLEK